MRKHVFVGSCILMVAALSGSVGMATSQQPPEPRSSVGSPSGSAQRALLDRYCVGCHNQRLKTAGLMLDGIDLTNLGANAETWEKVVKKLRAGAMPPVGRPRPDQAAHDGLVSWLETQLDRAAATNANAGKVAKFHRLNRTEYQNVVRDLLAIEIDAESMLPGDDAAFGFDNIGDALTVSPDLFDAYLAAARKVAYLAIGDPRPSGAVYPVSRYLLQADQVSDDLPFGSRGGAAIKHYFPYDGEYVIKARFDGGRVGTTFSTGASGEEAVQVRVDGARAAESKTLGRAYEDPEDLGNVGTRVAVKAGPRTVGVSFVRDWTVLPTESRFPQFYPWAHSAVSNTTTGANRYPLAVLNVEITGPYNPQGPGDTPSRRRVLVCRPASVLDAEPCATRILKALARRAYRRPVTDGDVAPLVEFYRSARRGGQDFDNGIRVAIERLLVDPEFLFRIERQPANVEPGKPYRITDLELASRLSFFLWSSIPDDELLGVAGRGQLKNAAAFDRQVRRMLADERARSLVTNFAAQWFFLRNVKMIPPDLHEFPDWDDNLRAALEQETELFIESQIRDDRSVRELLTADYTYLNERLAKHYNIPNVYGDQLRRVTLNDPNRMGLLSHGSIMMVTSFPNRTSPVLRGKWVLENLLGYPPPPPPPNVPDLPPADKQQVRSIRERLEEHRKNAVCASCHAIMDPLGFALENYDAIGTWRTVADRAPVDSEGSLPDGSKFAGPHGLRKVLEARSDAFVENVIEKLLTYALGRGMEYYDVPVIRAIARGGAPTDYRWSSIIMGVTKSMPFQMRMGEER